MRTYIIKVSTVRDDVHYGSLLKCVSNIIETNAKDEWLYPCGECEHGKWEFHALENPGDIPFGVNEHGELVGHVTYNLHDMMEIFE